MYRTPSLAENLAFMQRVEQAKALAQQAHRQAFAQQAQQAQQAHRQQAQAMLPAEYLLTALAGHVPPPAPQQTLRGLRDLAREVEAALVEHRREMAAINAL